jgi:hypothetical protein
MSCICTDFKDFCIKFRSLTFYHIAAQPFEDITLVDIWTYNSLLLDQMRGSKQNVRSVIGLAFVNHI